MKGKKCSKKILICILIIMAILIIACVCVAIYIYENRTKTLVIVKVNDNNLLCYGDSLYYVSTSKTGDIEFEDGQEILVFYNGMILTTYPERLSGQSKIFILKQDSDIVIPENVLKYAFSSKDNVNIEVIEISSTGMTYTIDDTNEIQYNYEDTYKLYKRNNIDANEEEKQVEVNNNIIIDEEGNISTPSYSPENVILEWEELQKDTYDYVYEQLDENIIRRTCDWTKTYGTLEEGEYYFMQATDGFCIQIYFSINENGVASDVKIEKIL